MEIFDYSKLLQDGLERSLRNGWPKVRVEKCTGCDKQFLVYVAEFEPSYGWCQAVLQGITELLPS